MNNLACMRTLCTTAMHCRRTVQATPVLPHARITAGPRLPPEAAACHAFAVACRKLEQLRAESLHRRSCCVAGACALTVPEDQLKETLELLAERHGLPLPTGRDGAWLPASHPLLRVEVGPTGDCDEPSFALRSHRLSHDPGAQPY